MSIFFSGVTVVFHFSCFVCLCSAVSQGNRVRNQSGGTNSNTSTVTSSPDTEPKVAPIAVRNPHNSWTNICTQTQQQQQNQRTKNRTNKKRVFSSSVVFFVLLLPASLSSLTNATTKYYNAFNRYRRACDNFSHI